MAAWRIERVTDEDREQEELEGGPESEPEAAERPSELEAALAERDKLKDQLLRTAADFDNFRKRSRRDLEDAERRGREETLRDILSVIDNLERAVEAASSATSAAAVAEGVQMVLRQFDDVATRLSLERVKSVGERFDPAQHDAVQQMDTADHPPGTIIAEVQAGYRLGERLLRPALVVVARPRPIETAPDSKPPEA
jgi:molecular chaperone GrpE